MKAIVIGAGMGGMSAAAALEKAGVSCEVFEAVTEMRPVGAAISVWSNGIKCLKHLGMGHIVERFGGDMQSMAYVDAQSGEAMTQFSLQPLYREVSEVAHPIARGQLQQAMIDTWGAARVQFGKRVVSVSDDGSAVSATFEDGSTVTADLLIGADGTHSMVRPVVLGYAPERRYAGYVNWNGLVEINEAIAPATQWTTFVGEGKRVSVMPVSDHRFYFFFDVPLPKGLAEDRSTVRADLKRYFAGWTEPVQRLIEAIDPATTNRIEVHDIEPFSPMVKGRIALLGDAAHSTTPDIGQGGCMAMEDAVALGGIFEQGSGLSIEEKLRAYQEARLARDRELVLKARKRCNVTHAVEADANRAWYEELRQETGEHIMAGLAHTIQGGPLG